MKISRISVTVVFSALILAFCTSCKTEKNEISFEAMDTFMTIQSYGKNSQKANEEVQKRITEIENEISTTKPESLVYQINNRDSAFFNTNSLQLNEDTYSILKFSLNIAEKTDGALNIALYPIIKAWGFTTGNYRVPSQAEITSLLKKTDYTQILMKENNTIQLPEDMEIDFGAVGKGFAGDEAIKIFRQYGITSALLNLGGNIQALGRKPDGTEWNVGIKNPWDGTVAAAIKIDNKAVVTSGGYERSFTENGRKYIHIFDGKTGYPVENDIASVTIITEKGLYGDAFSTAMFVLGVEKACAYWKQNPDFEMIILTNNRELYYTQGLKDKISPLFDFSCSTIIK